MENAKKFFEEVIKTEEAKTLLAATETPENEEARIAAYINIAKKLGIELTEDEINAYFATNNEADSAELDERSLPSLQAVVQAWTAKVATRMKRTASYLTDVINSSVNTMITSVEARMQTP